MLALTKKSEYALVAACHMARLGERVVSAREIAEQQDVPLPLLMNVLKKLNQAGQIRSVRGARGGYSLCVPPAELSLAAIIEAVEGPVHLVSCVAGASNARRVCPRMAKCALRRPVRKIHDRLMEFLMNVTVADLAFDADYGERRGAGEKAMAQ
ncbi:MAG: Rrf2 family transcriptional regulator [Phycisphaerae bacterium]|jgi:Rrf2 family protein